VEEFYLVTGVVANTFTNDKTGEEVEYGKIHCVSGLPGDGNGEKGLPVQTLKCDRELAQELGSLRLPVVCKLALRVKVNGNFTSAKVVNFEPAGDLADFVISAKGIARKAAKAPTA
jgi:hypothetical protein